MRKDIDGILAEKGLSAMLLHSESWKNANMYYLTKFLASDPFIFLKRIDEDPIIVVSQMELPRAKEESIVKNVRSNADYDYPRIVRSASDPKIGRMNFVASVVKNELETSKSVYVPPDFPAMLADVLRNEGLRITPEFDIVEKARETKESEEIGAIRSVQEIVEEATSKAIEFITNAEVATDGTLLHRENGKKKPLIVGKIRAIFNHVFADKGCVAAEETIITCGPKCAIPHYSGNASDVLKANQTIVLDVFPRSVKERYVSDMTRTVVKGKASKAVRKMFETVFQVRGAVLDAVEAGVPGNSMQKLCYHIFEKAGYETVRGSKKIIKGYLHGIGHGVGLEVHEGPLMGEFSKNRLEDHSVVTVEPGLYDPDIGGVRIEDVVEITEKGYNNLTKMEICLEV